jgi:unsaturated rhamnogalacturonyl hydrolase
VSLFSYGDLGRRVWSGYMSRSEFRSYTSILSLHGAARLWKVSGEAGLLSEVKLRLQPFISGEISSVYGHYGRTVYRYGGNASAYLYYKDQLPEAAETLLHSAELLCQEQSRDNDGLFDFPPASWRGYVWIDTVFGVCPFLLWVGLKSGRPEFIDESVFQMLGHHDRLFDPQLGLYHQAYNARGDNTLTPAHWSRGTGWGLLALAELTYDLPKSHPGYEQLLAAYRAVMEGCLNSQDDDGLWHQAMEDHGSYPETSGSALILYAMSRGLKNGALPDERHERFLASYLLGIRGLCRYLTLDGSVYNTCIGCLAPGVCGTVADYATHPWKLNDEHAAGPVIIMMSQAELLQRIGMIPPLSEVLEGKL